MLQTSQRERERERERDRRRIVIAERKARPAAHLLQEEQRGLGRLSAAAVIRAFQFHINALLLGKLRCLPAAGRGKGVSVGGGGGGEALTLRISKDSLQTYFSLGKPGFSCAVVPESPLSPRISSREDGLHPNLLYAPLEEEGPPLFSLLSQK
jgi:hypothetical protein